MADESTMERQPCGCQIGTDVIDGVNTFLIEPCDLTCQLYLQVMELSRAQGNSETFIDAS